MPPEKIDAMAFAKVYPMYIQKAERKGRSKEEIEDPLMQKIQQLDKLIDELAKGKAMDKVLRR